MMYRHPQDWSFNPTFGGHGGSGSGYTLTTATNTSFIDTSFVVTPIETLAPMTEVERLLADVEATCAFGR